MAESVVDRGRLSYALEVTPGTTPSVALQRLRFTADTLEEVKEVKESDEIREDRQLTDVMRTGVAVSGAINFELSGTTYDDFLFAALMASAWSSPVTVTASTISAANSDNSFNDSGNGFGSLVVGQWIKASGFTNATNNGYFKILTKTNAKITVVGKAALEDESSGSSRTIKMGAQIVNGTTKKTISMERQYTDQTNHFAAYRQLVPGSLNLTVTARQLITGSISLSGRREENLSATIGNGSYTAPTSTTPMNVTENLQAIISDMEAVGTLAKYMVQEVTLALNNNLRPRDEAGELGPTSHGEGRISLTGTLKSYYRSTQPISRFLNHDAIGLSIIAQDGAGNAYVIEMPSVRLTKAARPLSGINTDVMNDINWTARMHPTEGVMIRITRFP